MVRFGGNTCGVGSDQKFNRMGVEASPQIVSVKTDASNAVTRTGTNGAAIQSKADKEVSSTRCWQDSKTMGVFTAAEPSNHKVRIIRI